MAKEEEQGSERIAYFLLQTKNKPEQSKLDSNAVFGFSKVDYKVGCFINRVPCKTAYKTNSQGIYLGSVEKIDIRYKRERIQ